MKLALILLTTTVAAVWSVPLTLETDTANLNEDLSQANARILDGVLSNLIESLRNLILEGSGIIPPLDPLNIAQLNLDDEILPLPGARVALTGVTLKNLGTFEVNELRVSIASLLLQRYRLTLDVNIPSLDLSADEYEINLSALGFNIFGAGDLKIKVDPRISATVLAGVRLSSDGLFLTLLEADVKFSLSRFETQITGIFNDSLASDFVNLFLQDLVPSVVVAYEAQITEFLSSNVLTIGNIILEDLNIAGLLPGSYKQ